MSEKTGKKMTFQIFMYGVGIAIAIFLAFWLYGLYNTSRTTSVEVSKSVIACTGYTFEVDASTIVYSENRLSFLISNPYGDPFQDLIIEADSGDLREIKLSGFTQGSSVVASTDNISITERFELNPKGCDDNKKSYKVS